MKYKLYIDEVFCWVTILQFYIFMLTKKAIDWKIKISRIVALAVWEGIKYIVILLIPVGGFYLKNICGILITLLFFLLYQCMKRTGGHTKLKKGLICYVLFAMFFGGILLGVQGLLPDVLSNLGNMILLSTLIFGISYGCTAWFLYKKDRKIFYRVKICKGLESRELIALLDTGNMLLEPFSKRPVCIVESGEIAQWLLDVPIQRIRYIPYHSIGKQHGLMKAVEVDKVQIKKIEQEEKQEKNIEYTKAILAISKENLSENGKFQMILHPELLEY